MVVGGEEKDKPIEAESGLVLRHGTQNADLAVPFYIGGCRVHTRMMAIKTSLSCWNEGTR